MAAESNIEVQAAVIPRHYVLSLNAALAPLDMLELVQTLQALAANPDTEMLFDEEGACGGLFAKLREAAAEAYAGDLPVPIGAPITEEGGDEPSGGVPAAKP
jgi:hypothetical protein